MWDSLKAIWAKVRGVIIAAGLLIGGVAAFLANIDKINVFCEKYLWCNPPSMVARYQGYLHAFDDTVKDQDEIRVVIDATDEEKRDFFTEHPISGTTWKEFIEAFCDYHEKCVYCSPKNFTSVVEIKILSDKLKPAKSKQGQDILVCDGSSNE